jgi:hypothetical protein
MTERVPVRPRQAIIESRSEMVEPTAIASAGERTAKRFVKIFAGAIRHHKTREACRIRVLRLACSPRDSRARRYRATSTSVRSLEHIPSKRCQRQRVDRHVRCANDMRAELGSPINRPKPIVGKSPSKILGPPPKTDSATYDFLTPLGLSASIISAIIAII